MTEFYRKTALIVCITLGCIKLGEEVGALYADRFSKSWPHFIRKSCAHNEITVYQKSENNESSSCILLVHGIGNSSVSLVYLGEEIANLTHVPVVRYDRPGYGASRFCTDKPYSVTQSVDELAEIVIWLHEKYSKVTIIGHSYGGLLAYLALIRLDEPAWCNAILIEPSHLHEVVRDSKRMLGTLLSVEGLRNRYLLAPFGGELLDASIGPRAIDGKRYPYIDAVRRERRSASCVRATRREFTTLAHLLFDGNLIHFPRSSANIRLISSARSIKNATQRDLFTDYIHSHEKLIVLENTSHDTIILDRHAVKLIAELVRSGEVNVA